MKKTLLCLLMISCLFIFVGCSSSNKNGSGKDEKIYSAKIYYGDKSTETKYYDEGEYVSSQDFELPKSLVSSYFIEGWYTDSNYVTPYRDGRISSNLNIYAKLGTLKALSEYTFMKGVDKQSVLNYFELNGECISVDTAKNLDLVIAYDYQQKGYGDSFYRIKKTETWSAVSRESEVLYFPQGDLFIISFKVIEKSSIDTLQLYYIYQYKGTIEFALGQKLNTATYNGTYDQACIDGRTYTYKAKYTADFVFTPTKVNPKTLRFASFSTCSYTYAITDAMDYSAARKNFDVKDTGQKCYEKLDGCLNYLDEILQKINVSYKTFQ